MIGYYYIYQLPSRSLEVATGAGYSDFDRDIYVPGEVFKRRLCLAKRGVILLLQLVRNVDEKTGEIISQREKYIPDTMNEAGYKVPIHKLGAKLFADVPFPDEMTDTEIGKMARLSKLMIADSNMLGYRAKTGIQAYTQDQIVELVGLSRKRGREFLSKMLRLKVMQVSIRRYGDIEQEEFYVNPAYFFAGRRIGLSLYLLFREALDPILPRWVLRAFWRAANEQVKPGPDKK